MSLFYLNTRSYIIFLYIIIYFLLKFQVKIFAQKVNLCIKQILSINYLRYRNLVAKESF